MTWDLFSRFSFAVLLCSSAATSFVVTKQSYSSQYLVTTTTPAFLVNHNSQSTFPQRRALSEPLFSSSSADTEVKTESAGEEEPDYEVPEDAVLVIKPNAMKRLRELRDKQGDGQLILRMGVRSGGCSGMSYVMDFSTEDEIQEDDEIDEYPGENIKCVVDAKSMLYLYGLELDYGEELIGGGFKVS